MTSHLDLADHVTALRIILTELPRLGTPADEADIDDAGPCELGCDNLPFAQGSEVTSEQVGRCEHAIGGVDVAEIC